MSVTESRSRRRDRAKIASDLEFTVESEVERVFRGRGGRFKDVLRTRMRIFRKVLRHTLEHMILRAGTSETRSLHQGFAPRLLAVFVDWNIRISEYKFNPRRYQVAPFVRSRR